MRLLTTICALLLGIAPAIAQKSRPHRRNAKPVAAQSSTHDCGHNLVLHLSSPDPTQGSLLLLELRSATQSVTEIKATWDNREIPFWQEPKPTEKSPSVWRALLGIDLELKPQQSTSKKASSPPSASPSLPISSSLIPNNSPAPKPNASACGRFSRPLRPNVSGTAISITRSRESPPA